MIDESALDGWDPVHAGVRPVSPPLHSLETGLKGVFPFRLGTTSYIIPADIEPNARYLAHGVDDIEIVLFESDECSNIPGREEVSRLAALAREHSLTYTIHLPLDTHMGHGDESIRRHSVDKCRRIVEQVRPLNPFAYIVHFHGDRDGEPPPADSARWLWQHRRSVEELLTVAEPRDLCVETLSYPFRLVEEIVSDYRLGICLDVGHILLCGHGLEDHLERYLEKTRVVHLHGIVEGKDHRDISHLAPGTLDMLLCSLQQGTLPRVVTLEIFGEKELAQSLEVMKRYSPGVSPPWQLP